MIYSKILLVIFFFFILLDEFICFLQYSRSLQFDEKPDYNFLKSFFQDLFIQYEFNYDFLYQWDILIFDNKEEEKNNSRKKEKNDNINSN